VDLQKASEEETKTSYVTHLDEIDDINAFIEANYGSIYKAEEEEEPKDKINIDKIIEKFDGLKVNQLYFKSSFPNAVPLFSSKGVLFKYDKEKDNLTSVSENAILRIYKVESFKYYLVVDEDNKEITHTCTTISQDNNIITNREENLIMWLAKEENGFNAYNCIFYDEKKAEEIRGLLVKIKYESSSLSKFEELNADDREWLENENIPDELDKQDKDADVEMEFDNVYQEASSDILNKVTTQAYLHDRTFVVRENNTIGVYKTDEDDVLTVNYYYFIYY
jgi:hypothetical protein